MIRTYASSAASPSQGRSPLWRAALAALTCLASLGIWGAAGASAAQTVIPSGATAVSAGREHDCALLAGGTIECWGENYWGQLGDGSTESSHTPVSVAGISNATAISAGFDHSCAVLSGGGAKCWGENSWGQLGDGSTESSHTPVSVAGLSNATAISSEDEATCSLLSDETAKCWGTALFGRLGYEAYVYSAHPNPVAVTELTDATAISVGFDHACADLSSGGAKCWGSNGFGQLGNSVMESPTPVAVTGLTNATAISVGYEYTCALLSGGTAACWGASPSLDVESKQSSSTPIQVFGLTGATAISAGWDHACALLNGGAVECWGGNDYGQLGDGGEKDSATPVPATGITDATAISAGWDHTCALLSGGAVECWGGEYGPLEGPPSPSPPATPTTAKHPTATPPPKARITSHPPKETAAQGAPFGFTGVAGGSYECSVDAGAWKPCRSGEDFGPLAPGDHRFRVRETLDGLTGPADSYSWTIDLPRACVLRVARARVFAYSRSDRARLVIHYKTYRPAEVTVSYRLAGTRGPLSLGRATSRFQTAGIYRLPEFLSAAGAAKLRATTSMEVRFQIPAAPGSCARYYTKRLTIPKRFSGQTVWFQSDSVFGPEGGA